MIVLVNNYYNKIRGQYNIRKILSILLFGIFLINGFVAVAINIDYKTPEFNINNIEKNEYSGQDFSHTILGEFTTATWCTPCKRAHAALRNIYSNGWFPFYYVSLVWDKNIEADQRGNTELGATVYPTVFFDGGFKKNMGASSAAGAQAAYNTSINLCGNRTTSDINLSLDIKWLGPDNPFPENNAINQDLYVCLSWTNAEMNIGVTVDNNEGSTYNGHLRTYVTEVKSSMGWNDSGGAIYTFPFLEYAFNEDITIENFGTWQNDIDWDGKDYNTGYGEDYSKITQDNIMVIAAVFDDANDYVDETVGLIAGVDTDPKTFDVYFGESNPPPLISSNQSTMELCRNNLELSTTYYWRIVVWDNQGNSTVGPVWSFKTKSGQNIPPERPEIIGPIEGKINIKYDYVFTAVDSNGDYVRFLINWGDGTKLEWTGLIPSGEPGYSESHMWTTQGTYTIKAKAKDIYGAESEWTEFIVTMPRSKVIQELLILKFLQNHPRIFQIFQQIIQKLNL
ncbi:hypothetical protein AYK24_08020 [Thermoplasmatales archaeon SG8-52-4]|nr:MAG: hypothetical protein AYK24_08020 [Thermoplasmatales archaeon SG8-52-4]